ncbi:MAG: DUF3576 domain-containing protein [Magnetococcus sp. WYHC-3]
MNRGLGLALAVLMGAALSGCSGMMGGGQKETASKNMEKSGITGFGSQKDAQDAAAGRNDAIKDEGVSGLGLFDFGGGGEPESVKIARMRADRLFSGALDVVMELPVKVADRNGGFIATEWKVDPNDPGIRYRLNIRVGGGEPVGEVHVVVLKQKLVDGDWQDQQPDPALGRQIEKAIRKKALEVKLEG